MLSFDPLLDLQQSHVLQCHGRNMKMMYGHDEAPDEEHKAHQAVLAAPDSSARAAVGHIATPKNLILHLPLPLPLPSQAAPGAALLPCTVSSGLVKHLPAQHHFPGIQLCFIPCSIVICQLKRLEHVC